VELEREREVLDAVRKIESVKEAHAVYGVYDIVVKVEAETMDKLKETVNRNVRRLNKIRSTLTMIIMD
jgi:DNA-binding Lrp family transcriptional regulator